MLPHSHSSEARQSFANTGLFRIYIAGLLGTAGIAGIAQGEFKKL